MNQVRTNNSTTWPHPNPSLDVVTSFLPGTVTLYTSHSNWTQKRRMEKEKQVEARNLIPRGAAALPSPMAFMFTSQPQKQNLNKRRR